MGTERGRTADALLVVFIVNLVIIGPLAVFQSSPASGLTLQTTLAFIGARTVSTLIAGVILHQHQRIGASRTEPIKASQSLQASIIAVLVLEETMISGHFVGVWYVVAGVAFVSRKSTRNPSVETKSVPWTRLSVPWLVCFFFGLEPVFSKAGLLAGVSPLTGLLIKVLAGTCGYVAFLGWQHVLPSRAEVLSGNLKWYVAARIANTMFQISYYLALRRAPIVLVVPIIQTSPLFVIIFSFVFLQRLERVTCVLRPVRRSSWPGRSW